MHFMLTSALVLYSCKSLQSGQFRATVNEAAGFFAAAGLT
jgi:hypothetical protein